MLEHRCLRDKRGLSWYAGTIVDVNRCVFRRNTFIPHFERLKNSRLFGVVSNFDFAFRQRVFCYETKAWA
jgi:hypothetical protein